MFFLKGRIRVKGRRRAEMSVIIPAKIDVGREYFVTAQPYKHWSSLRN